MLRILVIEDERDIRDSVEQVLQLEGFEVITADNGADGVRTAQEQLPDLIISDVNMPELDGFGVLSELRKNKSTTTIPFIFLTARSDRRDFREGMDLGADDYLYKPFTIDELLNSVKTRLEKATRVKETTSEKLEELRTNITMSMPHELRTPLYGIIGFAEVLTGDLSTLDKVEIHQMSEMILENARRLSKTIENYLLFAHLQSLNHNADKIEQLRKAVTNLSAESTRKIIFGNFSSNLRHDDLELNIDSAKLKIHESYLKLILEQISSNCFDYSKKGTKVKITGIAKNGSYELSFEDNGRGMTKKQISEIGAFMQFDRNIYEQQGTGMGLALTKNIVNIFQGDFKITSLPEKGTTVKISLDVMTA